MANLLQTQDSLKSLSDQQLMSEMQDPTGQVPQFLVLSELKRRKDMRQQNQSPPSSTVADDLTQGPQQPGQSVATAPGMMPAQAPQQPASAPSVGIQSLASPVPGMREGGVVRMSGGGDPPPSAGLRGMTVEQLKALLDPAPTVTEPPTENAFSRFLRGGRRENLPEQQFIPIDPQTQSRAFGTPPRSAIEQALRYRMSEPGENTAAAQEVTTQAIPAAATVPATDEKTGTTNGTLPELGNVLSSYAPPPQRQTATGNAATQGNGVGALVRQALTATPTATAAPTAAPAAAPASAIPPGTTIDRSHLNSIMERMERERVNPATERENARNMALLQAGLAIAGGTSPHFAQNLAGAIPAIQGYQTQMTNLRKEGRDELKAQFDLAKADVEAQYHQGMLTEHQRKTALDYLSNQETNAVRQRIATENNAAQIQAARISAGGRDRPTDLGNHVRALMEANPTMSQADAYGIAVKAQRGGDTSDTRNNAAALGRAATQLAANETYNRLTRQINSSTITPERKAVLQQQMSEIVNNVYSANNVAPPSELLTPPTRVIPFNSLR
jgi:hypothetical protein